MMNPVRLVFIVWLFTYSIETSASTYSYVLIDIDFMKKCSENNGKTILKDACYIFVDVKETYSTSRTACSSMGAYLLSVTSPEELIHLRRYEDLTVDKLWVGLDEVAVNISLKWSDNLRSTMYLDQMTQNWTREGDGENCTAIVNEGESLAFIPCVEQHNFICKFQFKEFCYPGWDYDEEMKMCYRMFGTEDDNTDENGNNVTVLPRLSSPDAALACQSYFRGHLVTSFRASLAIRSHPYWLSEGDAWQAWIGIFSNPDKKGFVRDDGQEITLDWKNFVESYETPDLFTCSYYGKNTTLLNDRITPSADCMLEKYYLCEMPSMNAGETRSPTAATPPSACWTEGSISYSWYRIVSKAKLSGNVIATKSCSSRIDGAILCSNYTGCKSFNFDYSDGEDYVCELINSNGTLEYDVTDSDHIFHNCVGLQ